MLEETYAPVSIFEGLSFIGGIFSLIYAAADYIMDKVN